MENTMNPTQIDQLISQPPKARYEHFIRHTTEHKNVWGLVIDEDNWIMFKEDDGTNVFALWQSKELADACCLGEHRTMGAKPQAIPLAAFIQHCIPDMNAEGVHFGICFDTTASGLVVAGHELNVALQAAAQ